MQVLTNLLLNPLILNIGLLFFWAILILNNQNIKDRNGIFVTLAVVQWIFLSGLRHITIGGRDVYISYNYSFDRARKTSWQEAINIFKNNIFDNLGVKDPGYMIFEKTIGIFTGNYQIYLFIVAMVFMIPFGMFVYKNSKDSFISFLIYSTLFYSFFSFTGFRQTIATALIVLIGYELIKKKKLIPFMIVSAVAITIHKSAIIFFPYYFIAHKKITKRYLLSVIVIAGVILILGNKIYAPIAIFLGYEIMLENSIGGTQTFAMMMILLNIVGIWRWSRILISNPHAQLFFNATILGLILSLLALENQSFMRLQQYYSIFIVLTTPEILKTFKANERIIVYIVAIFTLLILFLSNVPRYSFFWQG